MTQTLPAHIDAAMLLEAWSWREQDRERSRGLALAGLEAESAVLRAQAQVVLAYLAFREGHLADALEGGGQAMLLLRDHEQTAWVARALNVRVCVTAELGDFASASTAIEEQLALSRSAGDLEMEACALHDIGSMQLLHDPTQAEPYLLAALEAFTKFGSAIGQAFTKVNLAALHEHFGHTERAQALLEETLALTNEHRIPLVETLAVAQQGRLAIQQGRFEEAETLLLQALERANRSRERVLWELVPSLVKVHLHFGRPEQALALLQDQLVAIQETGMRPFEVDAHALLAEVLEGIGDDRAALGHYRTHMNLYREVFSAAQDERTRALGALVRTQLAEQEAAAERQKNAELRTALEALEDLHQQMVELSFTDELTLVRNRRHLMTHGARQIREAQGQDFSVALLDLDHFKHINDTFGHDGGDRVLREFATVLQNHLRSRDTLARFGGEEFALLLPDTTPQTACDILERIRQVMAEHAWASLPAGEHITFTAGIADASCGDLMMALRHADERLYAGKTSGRDVIKGPC